MSQEERKKYYTIPCFFFLSMKQCPKKEHCWFAHHVPRIYKTKLCDRIFKTGQCKYGIRCTFAHSQEELQRVSKLQHFSALLDLISTTHSGS